LCIKTIDTRCITVQSEAHPVVQREARWEAGIPGWAEFAEAAAFVMVDRWVAVHMSLALVAQHMQDSACIPVLAQTAAQMAAVSLMLAGILSARLVHTVVVEQLAARQTAEQIH
jgi:hypothetical protein